MHLPWQKQRAGEAQPDLAATVAGGINPLSRSVRLYAVQMSHDYSTGRWRHQSVEPVGPLYAVQMSHDDCGFIIGLKTLVLCTVPAEAGWFASMSSREVLLMHATPLHGAGSAMVRITNRQPCVSSVATY